MPDDMPLLPAIQRTRAELAKALPDIRSAPREAGRLDLVVVRPAEDMRRTPESVRISLDGGVEGDHWAKGCWLSTEDGRPHPDVQICMMMSRTIRAIAGPTEFWPAAGDNLFLDFDLSPANCPVGTRLAIGTAELVLTEQPHAGCEAFIERYGRDACIFVNTGPGKELSLRGRYARVARDGTVSVGDTVHKLG